MLVERTRLDTLYNASPGTSLAMASHTSHTSIFFPVPPNRSACDLFQPLSSLGLLWNPLWRQIWSETSALVNVVLNLQSVFTQICALGSHAVDLDFFFSRVHLESPVSRPDLQFSYIGPCSYVNAETHASEQGVMQSHRSSSSWLCPSITFFWLPVIQSLLHLSSSLLSFLSPRLTPESICGSP
jgi:hypothetical protein